MKDEGRSALGVFYGGEEDEEGQVFGDFVKGVVLVRGDIEDYARVYVLGFVFESEFSLAGDDVVDFIFGMGLLDVGASSRKTVEANAEGGDIDEFQVSVVLPVVACEKFFELVGVHGGSYYAGWRTLFQ